MTTFVSQFFTSRPGSGGHPAGAGWRREAALVALLVAVAAILRLVWFAGLHGHDDWIYLFYTRSFRNGRTEELLSSLWGLRFLIWFPIHVWFELFGVSYAGAFAPGFLMGLATIPLGWCALRQMGYGVKVALMGGVFLIFNPIDWMVASTVRGDIEMSFYGGLILVLLLGMRGAEGRAKYGWGLAAGIAWGLSALTKEWGYIFAWGFFAVALAQWMGARRVPWAYLAVAGGFALTWAADAALLRYVTGDWLRRISASVEWYQRAADEGGYVNDPSVRYRYLLDLFLGLRTELTRTEVFSPNHYPYFGAYMWLLIAAFLIVGWRKGPARLVACFIAGLLLWVEFGSMSWREYLPYHKEPRYFTFISVPAAVLMAVAAARVLGPEAGRFRRWVAGCAIVAILGSTVWVVRANYMEYRAGRDFLPGLERWLAERPESRLWLTASLQQEMDLRFGYRFSDPVHGHAGEPGWGWLQDIEFWPGNGVGDLVLVDRPWSEFAQNHYKVNRLHFEHVAFIRGPRDVAEILRYVEPPHDPTGCWLGDIVPLDAHASYGGTGWNVAFDQTPLLVGGRRHERGIGVHSRSRITYAVKPEFPFFSTRMALLDSGVGTGSVVFSLFVDGQLRHRSDVMREQGRVENVTLDLRGARELTLLVEDAGDGGTFDHAAWLEPRMSASVPEPSVSLTK